MVLIKRYWDRLGLFCHFKNLPVSTTIFHPFWMWTEFIPLQPVITTTAGLVQWRISRLVTNWVYDTAYLQNVIFGGSIRKRFHTHTPEARALNPSTFHSMCQARRYMPQFSLPSVLLFLITMWQAMCEWGGAQYTMWRDILKAYSFCYAD